MSVGKTRKPQGLTAGGDKARNDFQTDPKALDCLIPYLPRHWVIWECAAGQGQLVRGFRERGWPSWRVFGSDIEPGFTNKAEGIHGGVDYLDPKAFGNEESSPLRWYYNVAVTNPPFDIKDQFLERAYSLGKPFAFLLPLTTFDSAFRRDLFRRNGVEVIIPEGRTIFTTPGGKVGGAWFMSVWITWGLNIGRGLTFPGQTLKRNPDGTKTPEYQAWAAMRHRCSNPNSVEWHNYGGRGIRVCKEWDSFEQFRMDVGPRPSSEHSLGRKDNDGNYEPGNVAWQTPEEQLNNTRVNLVLELGGRRMTLSQWSRELGIDRGTLGWRLNNGWEVEQALSTPARPKAKEPRVFRIPVR